MGKVVFQIDNVEYPAVDDAQVTPPEGISQAIESTGEKIVLFVLEHPNEGPAKIRIEVSGDGHREAQGYWGDIPENGIADYAVHGLTVSVCHGGKEM